MKSVESSTEQRLSIAGALREWWYMRQAEKWQTEYELRKTHELNARLKMNFYRSRLGWPSI